MHWNKRSQFLLLMAFHLAWGLVLWFSISKYGLGVSTDAVQLLFGGLNLSSGNGLTSYDGSFLKLWPPLYPVLLAFAHSATGIEMLGAAALLQAFAYLGLSACLALLFLEIFPDSFGLAVAATVLVQTGAAVVIAFGMAGSDYIHLSLAVLLLLITGRFIQTGTGRAFVALALVCVLITLQRYLGVAAVATSALTIVLLGRGDLKRRLGNGTILLFTALPMGMWFAITSRQYTRRDPISLAENFDRFSRGLLEWLLGPSSVKGQLDPFVPLLWFVLCALAALIAVLWRRPGKWATRPPEAGEAPRARSEAYLVPFLLYGICYGLAVFGSASIAYFNKLEGRFLLPLYPAIITLPVVAADGIIREIRRVRSGALASLATALCYLLLVVLAIQVLRVSYPIVIESHASGVANGENAFNNLQWRENPAMKFWLSQEPSGDYILLSNEPDGVAFYAQHSARPAPRRSAGPYADQEIPLVSYIPALFGSGTDVYLIWIEPNPYDHYYEPEELAAITELELLLGSAEGNVYELHPIGN